MSALYQLYAANLLTIAKTMVIKHERAAIAVNEFLEEKGYPVNWGDPASWKYYLNLSGEYHQYDHDVLSRTQTNGSIYITIKVAGSISPIDAPFTKQTLTDPTIATEYGYNSSFYKAVVDGYPEFLDLIHGILNPIDLQMAVAAPDNAILFIGGYSRVSSAYGGFQFIGNRSSTFLRNNLIESNELNIIFKLQEWLNVYIARWYNRDYSTFNEFYYPVMLSSFYVCVPGLIHNFRLQNCHTDSVHSYHVDEFLESHGRLYFPASKLPRDQRLWLYRNVRGLYNGLGLNETFGDIVDNIFTPSNIPLAGYLLKQNTVSMPNEFNAIPSVTKEVINFNQVGPGNERLSIDSLMDRQVNLARSNQIDSDYYQGVVTTEMKRAQNNNYITRTIDSQMLDLSDNSPYALSSFLLNMWGYTAATGNYTGTVFFTNPTNGERSQLTPINAYILMIYCTLKSISSDIPEFIPPVTFKMIPKPESPLYSLVGYPMKPTLSELKEGVTAEELNDSVLQKHLTSSGDLFSYNSPTIFGEDVVKLHADLVRRYRTTAFLYGRDAHVQSTIAYTKLYWSNVKVPLTSAPTTFKNWLTLRGLNFDTLAPSDFQQLALDIVKQATNDLIDRNRFLAELQSSAIDILKRFITYASHVVSSINRGNVLRANPVRLRYNPTKADVNAVYVMDLRPDAIKQPLRLNAENIFNLRFSSYAVNVSGPDVESIRLVRRSSRGVKLKPRVSHVINLTYPTPTLI